MWPPHKRAEREKTQYSRSQVKLRGSQTHELNQLQAYQNDSLDLKVNVTEFRVEAVTDFSWVLSLLKTHSTKYVQNWQLFTNTFLNFSLIT